MKEVYKKTDYGKIPVEWDFVKLNNIFNRITTKNKECNKNVLTISAQKGLINQEEFFNKTIASKDNSNYYLLEKGDFAYNKSYSNGYPMGAIKKLEYYDKGIVSPLYICFRLVDENSDKEFYKYFFEYNIFEKAISSIAQEGARNHGLLNVSVSEFFDLPIFKPPLKEQQEISEILSTIDTQIDDTDKLIEKTKELKKGLMQRLLTKGIGHTEFKMTEVGEIPVEWEIITVGKLVTLLKSGLSRSLKEENVGVPCIRSNNIKEDKLVLNDLKYWYNMDDKGAKIEDYILDEGDIIVNFINSISQIGKGCIFNKNDFRTIYTTNLLRIKVDNSKIINTFFYYYIQTERYRKEITLITKPAVNQASFTTVEYKSIKFPVPNLEEQRLISNILVSVDTQIEEYENKKKKLEELKKALMQQLLTGKIRVV